MELILKYSGIASLSLTILFVLFKNIIKKKIFPSLSQEQGYKILRLITLVFFIFVISITAYLFLNSQQATPPVTIYENSNTSMGNNNTIYNTFTQDGIPLFDDNKLPLDSLMAFLAKHDGGTVELNFTFDDLSIDTSDEKYTKLPYAIDACEKVLKDPGLARGELSKLTFTLFYPSNLFLIDNDGTKKKYYSKNPSFGELHCTVEINERNQGLVYISHGSIFIKGSYRIIYRAGTQRHDLVNLMPA